MACPTSLFDFLVFFLLFPKSLIFDQGQVDLHEPTSSLADRYEKLGKKIHLRHLSEDCRRLLHRAGDLVEVNISEDPHYHVANDHA